MNTICSLILGLLAVSSQWAHAAYCGRIESARGEVAVLRLKAEGAEKVRNAVKGEERMRLECADIVVTGKSSRAKLRFGAETAMTMGPFSRVVVAEEVEQNSKSPSVINLTYGKIRVLFKKEDEESADKEKKGSKDKSSSLRVKTLSAVVGVRGTDFYVSFEPNTRVTEQATLSGQVSVEQVGTKEQVLVKPGEQVSVAIAEASGADKLEVKPIAPQVVQEIRQTSVLVKDDSEFTSKEAVAILGPPKAWQPPADELPMDLKDIKEEF